jgi:hypothetical protein
MSTVYQNLPGLIIVYVDGTQVAGAVNIHHGHRKDPVWRVMSPLRLPSSPNAITSLVADNEEDARDWLTFLAGLYTLQPGTYNRLAAA